MVRIISISSVSLVLRSALLSACRRMRASQRTATSEIVPAAILRDGRARARPPQDEVRGFDFDRSVSWVDLLGREDPAPNLVFLDRLEQRLEISLAEAVVALPLDELEEDRADHGLGENLQQDLGFAAVDHALAVNEDPTLFHAPDRFGVTAYPCEAFLVIGIGRPGDELQAVGREPVGAVINRLSADRDVLDAFALILAQKFFDLGFFVGRLVDRNANASAWTRQRPRKQAGELALDVEEANLPEVEQFGVEREPLVHVAALYVVGQVIEIVKARPLWPRITLAGPLEFRRVGGISGSVAVDEVQQQPANAFDSGRFQGLVGTRVGLGAKLNGALEGMLCIDDAPRHRRGTRAVGGNEASRERAGLGIQNEVDVALAIDRDVLGPVPGDGCIAHAPEQLCKLNRLRMSKFDELEPVGADRVLRADLGRRRIVRKRTHISSVDFRPRFYCITGAKSVRNPCCCRKMHMIYASSS